MPGLSSSSAEAIGNYLNLIVVIAVFLSGLFWYRRSRSAFDDRWFYRHMAFTFWWLAWGAWLAAWVLISLKFPAADQARGTLVLCASDLNSVALLLVYFSITRGESYSWKEAAFDGLKASSSLGVLYAALYLLFRNDRDLALALHEMWGLCIAVAATLLVGWAFRLRFNTRAVLAVSFVYAFLQPPTHKVVLQAAKLDESKTVLATALIVLALMKIVWATVFLRVLFSGASSTRNLIVNEQQSDFQFWAGWPRAVIAQFLLVFSIFLVFLIQLANTQMGWEISQVASLVFGTLAALDILWRVWDRLSGDK